MDDDDDNYTSYSDLLNPQQSPQKSLQKSPQRPSSGPEKDTSAGSGDDLLQKQTKKVSLMNERTSLVSRRSELMAQINVKKRRAKALTDQKLQMVVDRTLTALIRQNDSQFGPQVAKELQKQLEVEKDDSAIMKDKLDVNPSDDWVKRLDYAQFFYNDVTIANASVSTTMQSERIVRVYKFVVEASGVFKAPIKLIVDSKKNGVEEISFESRTNGSTLRHIGVLCPSFHRALLDEYIPEKKLDSIMYGLNSLSFQLGRRISIFQQLIPLFKEYIVQTHAIQDFLRQPVPSKKTKALLRTTDKLEFLIPRSASYNEQKLTLYWDITLQDAVCSEMEPSIAVDIGSSGMVKNVTSIYLELTEKNGVVDGFRRLFAVLFNINVD